MNITRKNVTFAFIAGLAFAAGLEAGDVTMKMTTTNGASAVDFQDANDNEVASIDSSGKITSSSNVYAGGFYSMPELSNPGVASPNRARLYAKDIAGTTYLAYKDSSGTERVIKPQVNIQVADVETAGTNLGTTYRDVHWTLSASALSRTVVNFDGFTEARIVFTVDNNEADSISCRIWNETDSTEMVVGTSGVAGAAELVVGSWTDIALTGDKTVQAQCREGTGATADPDIGPVRLQLR